MSRTRTAVRWLVCLLLGAILLMRMLSTYGGGRYFPGYGKPLPSATPLFPSTQESPTEHAFADSVTILVDGHEAVDGSFSAHVTITNGGSAIVRELTIACDGLSENGTVLGAAQATIDNSVAGHETRVASNVRVPFLQRNIASARCSVSHVKLGSH